jgi:hypothetical protein
MLGDEITVVKTTGADCIHWSVRSRFNQANPDAVFMPGA